MKKVLLFWSLLVLPLCSLLAQRTISGMVSSDNDEVLVGASVVVKGTTVGTITDVNGNFKFEVPNEASILTVSFVGYNALEVAISSGVMSIKLSANKILDEVVVVGYGTQTKNEVTSSVSKISGDVLSKIPVAGLDAAMQGQAPGVFVTQNSGTPGGAISVRVRGPSSINGTNQPLYVIDGIPFSNGSYTQLGVGNQQTNALSDINPNDIESIEILKDAAAAAIYGSRANNGVVLVTTKRGKAGKPKIEFKTYYGNQSVQKKLTPITGPQYGTLVNEARAARSLSLLFADPSTLPTTDWQSEIFRTAPIKNTELSLSGGNERTTYYASGGKYDQEGIVLGSTFNRVTGRINLDNRITDKLKLRLSTSFSQSKSNRLNNDNNIYGVVSAAILMGSHIPVTNADGTYARDPNSSVENPVAAALNPDINYISQQILGNAALDWEIVKGLIFTTSYSAQLINFRDFRFYPTTTNAGAGVGGQATEASARVTNLLNENLLNYQHSFGKLKLSALAGLTFQNEVSNFAFFQGEKFPGNTIRTFDAASVKKDIQSSGTQWGINSYLGRLLLSWDNRYTIQGVVRADGSSRFGADKRWGIFPSVSGAWVVSEEPFWSGIKSVVSTFKLKAGYGIRGSSNIANFASRGLIAGGANYNQQPGLAPTQLANTELGWEEREDINVGVEIGLLKDRISLIVEPYKSNMREILLTKPVVFTTGFGSLSGNAAKMEGKGVDIGLKTLNFTNKNFTWSTNFNIATMTNKVTDYPTPTPFGFASWLETGYSITSFRGYRVASILQTQDEITALDTKAKEKFGTSAVYQTTLTKPGDIKFVDINNDGRITVDDQEILGNALPKFTGGISNDMSLNLDNAGSFDLSFFFQFVQGNKIYNNTRAFSEGMNGVFGQTAAVLNRWTPTNTNTDVPRAVWQDPNNNRRSSDRWLEDGSYIRLKNLTFGYTLPKSLLSKVKIQNLRVYFTGQNLWTKTKYSGLDPEVSTFAEGVGVNANTAGGTDFLVFPQAKSFIFGLNVGF